MAEIRMRIMVNKMWYFPLALRYRKIPNISPGLINIRQHFLGTYIRVGGGGGGVGLYSGSHIFGGHFVLVSEYQDFKVHCYISLL